MQNEGRSTKQVACNFQTCQDLEKQRKIEELFQMEGD